MLSMNLHCLFEVLPTMALVPMLTFGLEIHLVLTHPDSLFPTRKDRESIILLLLLYFFSFIFFFFPFFFFIFFILLFPLFLISHFLLLISYFYFMVTLSMSIIIFAMSLTILLFVDCLFGPHSLMETNNLARSRVVGEEGK